MKRSFQLKAALFFVCAFMFSVSVNAQDKKPLASPRDSVSGVVNGAHISINYGSPSVKGRKIWGSGALVPFDTVWRAGANEATRFTTDKDIKVAGKTLPAGTYGFFTIPGKKKWVIIFNSVPIQWGAYKYDSSKDVLRVKVKIKPNTMNERLVYTVNDKGFALAWEDLIVPVKVK